MTVVIPPPSARPSQDVPSSPSRPVTPPPEQFPLRSVEIPVPLFRLLAPKSSSETREETMTPACTDSHGGTIDPTAESQIPTGPTGADAAHEKPTSPKLSTPPPDTDNGAPLSPRPSTTVVDVVPKPKSKKLTARPKASAAPSVRHQITLHTSRAATLAASQTAPCFGNVLVQIRSGDSLGSLEHYAQA
jgi:hypothetical protein